MSNNSKTNIRNVIKIFIRTIRAVNFRISLSNLGATQKAPEDKISEHQIKADNIPRRLV